MIGIYYVSGNFMECYRDKKDVAGLLGISVPTLSRRLSGGSYSDIISGRGEVVIGYAKVHGSSRGRV